MLRKWVIFRIIGLWLAVTALLGGVLVFARSLPAGEQIVYMANLHAQYDLFLTDLKTHHTLQLTRGQSQNSRYPAWSPDGRYLAYHGNIKQSHGIFIMDTQTWQTEWLDFGMDELGGYYDDAMVNWSPDGSKIAFHRGNNNAGYAIYMADVQEQRLIRLTEGHGQDIHAYWSPDGTKIVYSQHLPNESGMIHILDVQDAIDGVDHVGQKLIGGIFPAWSPDGASLVYVDLNYDIVRFDLETDIITPLTNTPVSRQNTTPDWSPDGEWIIFSSNQTPNHMIYRIRRDGTDIEQIPIPITRFNLQAPAYRP